MPREMIQDDDSGFGVEVNWTKDDYMQVGVVIPESETIIDRFYGADPDVVERVGSKIYAWVLETFPEADAFDFVTSDQERDFMVSTGRMAVSAFEEASIDVPSGSGRYGIWWTPTRYAVNRLVDTLRNARNGVFGKDA